MKRRHILTTAIFAASIFFASPHSADAASFNFSTASTTAQTLAATETGVITATGSLTTATTVVPITVTGNSTITNSGQILQTGTGRGILNAAGTVSLAITNNAGALIRTADADTIRITPATTGGATLDNYGTISSLNASKGGSQAVDWSNITSGSNVITNYSTGLILSSNADSVRPGTNGIINNYGTIRSTVTTDTGSDAIDAQANGGVTLNNFSTGLVDSSRHGITGGPATALVTFTTAINNSVGGIIRGNNGSGVNLDGFNANQTAIIVNGGTITGNGVTGDGDGVDVDGVVNITNTGTIRSINAVSITTPAQSEGISVGGGIIINSGTIEGLVAAGNANAVGRGISLLGNDITTGPLAGTREAIYANAVVTNQAGGLIRGGSDSGIAVDGPASGFTVTIHNNAGATIQGGATIAGLAGSNAAIRTGADNDTINNAGTINGSSNGKAIDMGAGNNTLNITGGAASVIGDISGGVGGTNVMTINPGAGNNFSYSGSISNFGTVEAKSGLITLSGVNAYTGTTRVTGGIFALDGASRISASSALDLNGGTVELLNAGINGQTFASLSLDDHSVIDLDFAASLTFNGLGTVLAGKTLTVSDYSDAISHLYAFRFLGDLTSNADFLTLIGETTINGAAATFSYDGAFTDVTPVPEPATVGFGIAVMMATLFRRRRSA